MSTLKTMNFTAPYCRLCLANDFDNLKGADNVDNMEWQQNVLIAVGVEIRADDGFSRKVCRFCMEKINSWLTYKEQCLENQMNLDHWLKTSSTDINDMNIQIKEELIDEDMFLPAEHLVKTEAFDTFHDSTQYKENGDEDMQSLQSYNSDLDHSSQGNCFQNCVNDEAISNFNSSESITGNSLSLYSRDSIISSGNLTDIENSYVEKIRAILKMYNSLMCVCHNRTYESLKRLSSHARSANLWFPIYTCYHCVISFTDRSSVSRHNTKCRRNNLERLIELSNLTRRGKVKTRLYQNFKCIDCKFVFSFHEDFCQHVDEDHVDINMPYRCSCGKIFAKISDYQKHAYFGCLVEFFCDICTISVPSLEAFQEHAVEIHDNSSGSDFFDMNNFQRKSLVCEFCDKQYLYHGSFAEHQRKSHPERMQNSDIMKYVCVNCDAEFLSKGLLSTHEKYCPNPKNDQHALNDDKDDEYLKTFALEFPLNRSHEESKEDDDKNISCNICYLVFENEANLLHHKNEGQCILNSSHSEDDYRCNTCVVTFPSKGAFKKHNQRHHSKTLNLVYCKHCKTSFKDSQQLLIHINDAHSNMKTFDKLDQHNCKLCDRTFSSSSGLYGHLGWHKKNANKLRKSVLMDSDDSQSIVSLIRCAKCNLDFDSKEECDQHQQLHIVTPLSQNDKDYPCMYCHCGYNRKDNLQAHMRKNHPQYLARNSSRGYTCRQCERVFDKQVSLNIHIKVHEKQKTVVADKSKFLCSICNKGFNFPKDLRDHTIEAHPF